MTSSTITAPALRSRACPLCDAPAGEPCQPKPSGDHLARWLDAYTAGQLSRAYMAMTVGELVVIDECAVIAAQAEPDTCTCGHPGADHNVMHPGVLFPCQRCACADFADGAL